MKESPQSIKYYSTTRWNGVAVLFESVLDNNKTITDVFSAQAMATPADRVLNLRPGSKVTDVKEFATDGS